MLVTHKILLLTFLLVCIIGKCNKNNCQINDDVEYLNTEPLCMLHAGNNDLVLPIPYGDYNIPNINSIILSEKKVGKELNIYPPVALIHIIHESCLVKHESIPK